MPFYVGDYLRDTRRLSTVEHGAYLLLIMEYWTQGGLPDDDKKLARIAGLSGDEWAEVRDNLSELFQPGWKHKRVDAELATAADKSDAAREKANKRWQASGNAKADAPAMPQHSQGICPEDASHNHSHSQREDNKLSSHKRALVDEFSGTFWPSYPNKVGKPAAEKAYQSARKRGAELSQIMAGLNRYMATKPPDRSWLNPATFLNQERWADQPATTTNVLQITASPDDRAAALAKQGQRWVEYDTPEWSRVADIWKVEKGMYPPHPNGGWYFPISYFPPAQGAAA
jgi:uncharacterized protein YdaU (DUF1376 family)